MSKLHVKRGDTVVVITGKEKLKKGPVIISLPSSGKVVVEGVNTVTRHVKPKRHGEPGGRIKKEAPIDVSNVMLFCNKCNRGVRVSKVIKDGKKVRVCKKCGSTID